MTVSNIFNVVRLEGYHTGTNPVANESRAFYALQKSGVTEGQIISPLVTGHSETDEARLTVLLGQIKEYETSGKIPVHSVEEIVPYFPSKNLQSPAKTQIREDNNIGTFFSRTQTGESFTPHSEMLGDTKIFVVDKLGGFKIPSNG